MANSSSTTAAAITTLIIVCLVFFIDIANLGMANIALPTIRQDLGYDNGSLQWILTAYALTFGGFLMTGGRLGDIFGHRHVLISGMTLFNLASLTCALVSNKIGLVVGRAFQGLAAALTIPSAQSIVSLLFENPQSRVKAFAAWGACGSTGFVFGPIFGGLFTSLVTWQWIFWFSLIVEGALELVAFALLFVHNSPVAATSNPKEKKWTWLHIRLDAFGTALAVPALILLVYGLTTGNVHGWQQADVIATLVVAVVLSACFAFVEVKVASDPVFPKYVWGDRIRILGCVVAALTYAVWQGCNYLLTLQLQAFGFSPLSTALRFIPLGVTAMAVNFVVPAIIKPVGSRNLLLASWLITVAGIVLLSRMASEGDYWRFGLPGMILYIAGVGTVYFVGNVTVVATATEANQGTVSGVYNMCLNVGGAVLGVAVLTAISNAVASQQGGTDDPDAVLAGYRAGYYGAIAMAVIGFIVAVFFTPSKTKGHIAENQNEGSEKNQAKVESPETSLGKPELEDKGVGPVTEIAVEHEAPL